MLPAPDPELMLVFQRAQRRHHAYARSQSDDPMIWAMIAVMFAALLAVALTTHWFAI